MKRVTSTTALGKLHMVSGFGRCEGCNRNFQYLANGLCEDCRFYGIAENDKELSRLSTEAVQRGRISAHRAVGQS